MPQAAVLQHNSSVTLLEFNDRLELNGNLPIPLQQHEWLGGGVVPASFSNLHTAFPGVPAERLASVIAADDRVLSMPGQPPAGEDTPVMFAGYSDVTPDRSLFYLLAHTTSTSEEADAPLVIWLQGGNGCSSMLGAFSENGPCVPKSRTVEHEASGCFSFLLWFRRPRHTHRGPPKCVRQIKQSKRNRLSHRATI